MLFLKIVPFPLCWWCILGGSRDFIATGQSIFPKHFAEWAKYWTVRKIKRKAFRGTKCPNSVHSFLESNKKFFDGMENCCHGHPMNWEIKIRLRSASFKGGSNVHGGEFSDQWPKIWFMCKNWCDVVRAWASIRFLFSKVTKTGFGFHKGLDFGMEVRKHICNEWMPVSASPAWWGLPAPPVWDSACLRRALKARVDVLRPRNTSGLSPLYPFLRRDDLHKGTQRLASNSTHPHQTIWKFAKPYSILKKSRNNSDISDTGLYIF